MNKQFIGRIIIFSLAWLFLVSGVLAEETLRGKAFCDPEIQQDMPADWVSKQVNYHESAGDVDMAIDLNQQLYPQLLPLVRQFEQENKIKIHITEGTCGKSAGKLGRKEVDMGGFCCPPGEIDRLPGLRFHTLGITPLAILVHPDNPVSGITLDDARKVFQGDITSWSELNGDNSTIQPISSLHCKKRPGHWRLLLDNENLFSSQLMEIGDMTDQIALIGSTPHAIGYETLNVAERFKDRGKVKALAVNGDHPKDLTALLRGRYPIYRVFNVTTWEGDLVKNKHAGKLVRFLLSKVELIETKAGLVTHSKLKAAGWQFKGDELTGEPR